MEKLTGRIPSSCCTEQEEKAMREAFKKAGVPVTHFVRKAVIEKARKVLNQKPKESK